MSSPSPTTPLTAPKLIRDLNKNFATLITTSLGVTAALSFNDAIKSLFETGGVFHGIGRHGVWYTALFVTLLAFFATYIFTLRYPDSSPSMKQNPITV